jgi:hypothetical protein
MYLSRIQLRFNNIRPEMLKKWDSSRPYASHQWLWQLFPEQGVRQFLFRQEDRGSFFMLSITPPLTQHPLFLVETKSFNPQLTEGMVLDFQLRANPVITRNGKRSDVMMNAKYEAKANGVVQEKCRELNMVSVYLNLNLMILANGPVRKAAKHRRAVDVCRHISSTVSSVKRRTTLLLLAVSIFPARSGLPMLYCLSRRCFLGWGKAKPWDVGC